jgi:hypothetical protein
MDLKFQYFEKNLSIWFMGRSKCPNRQAQGAPAGPGQHHDPTSRPPLSLILFLVDLLATHPCALMPPAAAPPSPATFVVAARLHRSAILFSTSSPPLRRSPAPARRPHKTLTARVGSVAGVAPTGSRCSPIKLPCCRPRAPGVLLPLPWAGRLAGASRVVVRW